MGISVRFVIHRTGLKERNTVVVSCSRRGSGPLWDRGHDPSHAYRFEGGIVRSRSDETTEGGTVLGQLSADFEDLLEAMPDALVGVDRAGIIRFVNRQAGSLFGSDLRK